ncbi:Water stress and hypersensitive response domain-containing protein [Deinococcus irradiatisoli]|uniref:Water stress and hypersensitive response domain-containing protein n=1 Tax=Deinococcus irradiatisoli TaxID=2202254 RepID=A0A2Z3JRM3_9DEIO|nr:LEA type 2 family protein [Deinococcus irradiatisoli]AWN23444.1 Water stress and hypersensitive response domain-containing protein [Deinococcus irradiatisoli]
MFPPSFRRSLRRVAAAALLPGALLSLSGCAPALKQVLKVPTFSVQQTRLTGLTLGSPATARVSLKLRIDNPNPVAARLANISGQFYLNGADVGNVNLPNVNLPARGSAVQEALLELPVSLQTAAVWLQVARGREMPYRVDGTFTADFGALGQPSFGPYTLAQGLFQQKAILP